MAMQFFSATAFEESVSAVTATNSVELGARRLWKGEEYVYCYNADGGAIQPTYGVKVVTGASGYSVAATSLTDVANPCVGVVKHATLTTDGYGWILVKGFTRLEYHANSAITSDYFPVALGVGGTFTQVAPITDAVHKGTFAVCAYAIGANTGSGGSFYGFVRTGF